MDKNCSNAIKIKMNLKKKGNKATKRNSLMSLIKQEFRGR